MGQPSDFQVIARTASDVGIDGTYDDPAGPTSVEWTWPHLPQVGHRVRFGNSRWFRVLSLDWTAPNPQGDMSTSECTLVITITDDPPEQT